MIAPATGLIAVFIVIPMLLTIWLSFQNWSTQTVFETAKFVGVQNFIDIFANNSVGRDFKAALTNTAIYTMLSVALIPVAYYTGDTFKPGSRRPVEEITYLNRWKLPIT